MIVGAGLAGLISAHAFPREHVVELSPEPSAVHRALLRFRTPVVGELTGIEFKPVTVYKGIFAGGTWHEPSIRLANLYAKKVVGRLVGRSIWNTDDAARYIAPIDFYDRLVESVSDRICWDTDWREAQTQIPANEPVISTIPMSRMLETFALDIGEDFKHESITVRQFKIRECDLYQTVYFPTLKHSLYRASITGDLLICEFADEPEGHWQRDLQTAFAIDAADITPLESCKQTFGKIAPIDEGKRRAAIAHLTEAHNIFSIGRFATWRHVLLDDVVHDTAVIKRLINGSAYDRKLSRQTRSVKENLNQINGE